MGPGFAVERDISLHFTLHQQFGVLVVQDFDRFGHFQRERFLVGAEIGVGEHRDNRFDTEPAYRLGGHQCDFGEVFGTRRRNYGRIGEEHRAAFGGDDLHCRQPVRRLEAEYLPHRFERLDVAVPETEQGSIRIARSDHHQREPVALHHVFERFGVVDTLAAHFAVQ